MLTTQFVNGAPNWIDVGSPDIDGTISFYGGLFGWQFQSAGPDAGGYGFFQRDGKTVTGAMPVEEGQVPPSWTVYFQSPDAQATAKAVESAHGTVLFQPVDVMGEGHMALFVDPAGCVFGIWQPGHTKGVEAAGETNSLTWVELFTPDIAAAAAFYHATLGLETSAVPFPGGKYTCVNPAEGGQDAMFGGIVPTDVDPAAAGPHWVPYFEVADTDATLAKAQELGGRVTTAAVSMEGVGRFARLTDPYGARFAVITSVSPQS